jgi:hypothetical protein
VGLFDSEAVKELKKQSQFIGGLIAHQAFGQLPLGAAEEMVNSDSQRARLKQAFTVASREMGGDKALKKAVKAAGDHARMCAQVRSAPWRDVEQAAEGAISEMLQL